MTQSPPSHIQFEPAASERVDSGALADTLVVISQVSRFTRNRVEAWVEQHPDDRVPLALIERLDELMAGERNAQRHPRTRLVQHHLDRRFEAEAERGVIWSPVRDRADTSQCLRVGFSFLRALQEYFGTLSSEAFIGQMDRLLDSFSSPIVFEAFLAKLPSDVRRDRTFVATVLERLFIRSRARFLARRDNLRPSRFFDPSDDQVARAVSSWIEHALDELRAESDGEYLGNSTLSGWVNDAGLALVQGRGHGGMGGRVRGGLLHRMKQSDPLLVDLGRSLSRYLDPHADGPGRRAAEVAEGLLVREEMPLRAISPSLPEKIYRGAIRGYRLKSLLSHPDTPLSLLRSAARENEEDHSLILHVSQELRRHGRSREASRLEGRVVRRTTSPLDLASLVGRRDSPWRREALERSELFLEDRSPDEVPYDLANRLISGLSASHNTSSDQTFSQEDLLRLYDLLGRGERVARSVAYSDLLGDVGMELLLREHGDNLAVLDGLVSGNRLEESRELQDKILALPDVSAISKFMYRLPIHRQRDLFLRLVDDDGDPWVATSLLEHHLRRSRDDPSDRDRTLIQRDDMLPLLSCPDRRVRERAFEILGRYDFPAAKEPARKAQSL